MLKPGTPTHSLQLQLLGRFQVLVDGRPIDEHCWSRRSARNLLQLLALRPAHQMHKEQAMQVLWPHAEVRAAENNLNKAVHLVRRTLQPDASARSQSRFLFRNAELIALRADDAAPWVDVEAFEKQASQATRLGTLDAYEAALTLYAGALLEDDPYTEWVDAKRAQLAILHQELVLATVQRLIASKRYPAAVERVGELLAADPSNERAHRQLMELYWLAGRRRDALTQYEHCRTVLREMLDCEPEPETESLHQRIAEGLGPRLERDSIRVGEPSDTPVASLAILPIANATDDLDLTYLCEGITESLINRIARLTDIRVMAYSSVARYTSTDADPQAIGRQLGVPALLIGRVTQSTDTLMVHVELVQVADGALLWGEHYHRAQNDIFTIEEEIASNIMRMLLSGFEAANAGPSGRDPVNAEAYRCYLRGRFHWNKRTGPALRAALADFEVAIEHDPTYALAYAGLADCYNLSSLYNLAAPGQAMSKARAAALRAIDLDTTLAEAHTSLAYYHLYYEWDWANAEREFLTALRLDPNYATAYHWYHELLTALGRFEEQTERIMRAKSLDPLSLIINTEVGWGLYFARHFEQAIADLTDTLRLESHFPVAHLVIGCALNQQARYREAVTHVRTAIDLQRGSVFPLGLAVLGHIHAINGRAALAREQQALLRDAEKDGYVPAYCHALIAVGMDDHEQALDQLERACEARDDRIIYLGVDPMLDALRSSHRFKRLLQRLGLPP